MKKKDLSYHISNFLSNYLVKVKGFATNTITTYKDAMIVFITFLEERKKKKLFKIDVDEFNSQVVIEFLDWVENSKGRSCKVSTRNNRLSIIKSFCRYLMYNEPEHFNRCQMIIGIPSKRGRRPYVEHLSKSQVKRLLDQPNLKSRIGLRHMVMLSVLYESGTRVSEMIQICPASLHLEGISYIHILGKGNKERNVVISKQLVRLLKKYMAMVGLEKQESRHFPLFFNHQGEQIGRQGVSYVLSKYVKKADITVAVSPHCLRHSRAIHMLEEGVDIVKIRDFLGHESVTTTERYLQLSIKEKEKVLAVYDGITPKAQPQWRKERSVLQRLRTL